MFSFERLLYKVFIPYLPKPLMLEFLYNVHPNKIQNAWLPNDNNSNAQGLFMKENVLLRENPIQIPSGYKHHLANY